jgi:hypothetical protein
MPPLNPEIWHLIIGILSLLLGYYLKSKGIAIPGLTPNGSPSPTNPPPLVALLRDALGQQRQQEELLGLLRELLGNAPDRAVKG